ncbi:MAG: alpha-E domain-containing protein [Magnetococcus sp. WYHC-3]
MMLSRVAENIYWMARYLERAEDTARLVIATDQTMLDIAPVSQITPLDWNQLLAITGQEAAYRQRHPGPPNEQSIIRFLVGDRESPASIVSSLTWARENLRSTREAFPREMWEFVNEFTRKILKLSENGVPDAQRHEFLELVVSEALMIAGLLDSSMCRDDAFNMFRLGQFLERSDMITRIIDVRGAGMQSTASDDPRAPQLDIPLKNAIWLAVLKSLSGDQMYRRRIQPIVRGNQVLAFLLKDPAFPRAFRYCLDGVTRCLETLGRDQAMRPVLHGLDRAVYLADVGGLAERGLHAFLDDLQIRLGNLHNAIQNTYFTHRTEA